MAKKVKVYKLRFEGSGGCLIDRSMTALVETELDAAEVGDKYTIEVAEMTEGEIEALPEFDGF
jgi:hypothetical protein